MNCKKCFRCDERYPSDDLTPDAFGDFSVCICDNCMCNLKTDSSKYLLVEVPEYSGITFVMRAELEDLRDYVGDENLKVLSR